MQHQVDSCKMILPDGRNVELCSQEGADAFLETPGAVKRLFTSNNGGLGDANRIRKKSRNKTGKNRLNAGEKSRLTAVHFTIESFSRYCSPAVFEDNVTKNDIEFWLDHVIVELKEKTKDERWQQMGVLEPHDAFVLNPCVPMFLHTTVAVMAFDKGFFNVLSDFIEARKGTTCIGIHKRKL